MLGYRGIEENATKSVTKSVYQGEWHVGRMAENTREVEGMTSWGDAKERMRAREIKVKVPSKHQSSALRGTVVCGVGTCVCSQRRKHRSLEAPSTAWPTWKVMRDPIPQTG